MKLSIALLSVAVAGSVAQPHRHGHQHLHKEKRQPNPVVDNVIVAGPTAIVYVLNGATISEADVMLGIKNGSLVYASDGQLSSAAKTLSSTPPPPPPTTTSTSTSTSIYVAPTSKETPPPAQTSQSAPSYGSGTGLDTDFPDGEIDCSTFPSDYGAIPVEWTGLGGWTGIQCPASSGAGGYSNIETKTPGGSCEDGAYCSYACPAGYQKTQWPDLQGSTGQSVGGLLCENGKLKLTNPSLSKKLCMTGSTAVNIQVQNKLSKNVAICRTDYPGTESETVPVNAEPGATSNLTCPDADNYYKWQGGSTSAQYYVNPAGVDVSDACQWGSEANPWGNFAPLNLGVGYSNGAAWLSIFQNSPTTDAKLEFCVTIEGDGVSGKCRYSNGQYCSGDDYSDCNPTAGCTVSLSSGTATFVFTD